MPTFRAPTLHRRRSRREKLMSALPGRRRGQHRAARLAVPIAGAAAVAKGASKKHFAVAAGIGAGAGAAALAKRRRAGHEDRHVPEPQASYTPSAEPSVPIGAGTNGSAS
jgi:hypothetical protein